MNTGARCVSATLAFLVGSILPGYAQTQFSFSYSVPISSGGTITASGTLTTTGSSPYQVTAISGTRTVTGAASGNGTATITGLVTNPAGIGYNLNGSPNLLYYGVTPLLSSDGIFYTISNASQEDANGAIDIYYDSLGQGFTENSTLVGDGTFTASISGGGSAPNGITIISGNTQAVAQGAAFQPLVVQVNSATGPLANYPVSLSSTGPVALSSSTVNTGSNGQASIPVTAGVSSAGAATVTASVTGGFSVTFNLTVNTATGTAPTAISIISGNTQAVAQGASFQPLVVQVNGAAGPLANQSVVLSSTGPVVLSSSGVTTGSNGQASIPVTAGTSSSGAATVTASVVGGFSVTFNLTVNAGTGTGGATGITIISGNNQAVAQGASFQPLVLQINTATGPLANQLVVLSTTGPVALAFSTVTTGNNGQASIQVIAGLSSGAATVTASIVGYSATFNLTVNAPDSTGPTGIAIVSTQAVAEGAAFQPLIVQVNGASGPLANQSVLLSSTGPVVLSSSTVTTGGNGQASIPVTAGTASGPATVTAGVTGGYSVTFYLTVNPAGPTATGIALVSGDMQAVAQGAAFQALVVQVNGAAGPLATYTVNLSSTGPVGLSSSTVTTGSNGQASILVTAGTASGPATVTASVTGGFSVTFNLTVNPPGPVLTANSFLNAASGAAGQLSPCSLAIISAPGLTPDAGIADLTSGPIFGRWSKSVNNLSVTFSGVPAPILRVSPGSGATNPQVMLQVPCEVTPGDSVPVVVNVNGAGTATINIPIFQVSPAILTQPMSDGVVRAVATRADGSFADVGGPDSYDPNNPVRQNEYVRFYLTGLGITTSAIGTGYIDSPDAPSANVDAMVVGTVVAGIVNGPSLQVISARAAPDLIGVYEIKVLIPANAPAGNSVGLQIGITPVGGTTTVYAPNVIVPIGQ